MDAKAEALRQARVRATEANARWREQERLAELRVEHERQRAERAKRREEKQQRMQAALDRFNKAVGR